MEWWRKVGGARGVGNGLAGQGQGRPEPASLFLLRALGTLFAVGGAFARNLRCQLGRRATPSSVAVSGFRPLPLTVAAATFCVSNKFSYFRQNDKPRARCEAADCSKNPLGAV